MKRVFRDDLILKLIVLFDLLLDFDMVHELSLIQKLKSSPDDKHFAHVLHLHIMVHNLISLIEQCMLSLIGLVHGHTLDGKGVCLGEDYFNVVCHFGVIPAVDAFVGLVFVLYANFHVFAVFDEVGFSLVKVGVDDEGVACQIMNSIGCRNINNILLMFHKLCIAISLIFLKTPYTPQTRRPYFFYFLLLERSLLMK